MSALQTARPPRLQPHWFARALAGAAAALVLFAALFAFAILLFQFRYLGRIYPGVSVGGVDLSGVRRTQAAALLAERIDYPGREQITLEDGEQSWTLRPADLGLFFEAQASADAAYRVGRDSLPGTRWLRQLQVWRAGQDIRPVFVLDGPLAQLALDGIAARVNQPVREASLGVVNGQVLAEDGQVGRSLDVDAAIRLLEPLFKDMQSGRIALPMVTRQPQVLDVGAQAELARRILSQPLTLDIAGRVEGDPGPWTLDQAALADMLTIERTIIDGQVVYQVGLNAAKLRAVLEPLGPVLTRDPHNARFIFNDETRQLEVIQPSLDGRRLLVEESIQHINQRLGEGAHTIELVFDLQAPEVSSSATAADLGITELVSDQTTYFYGSSAGRIQNIQTAGSRFHGLLIAPGAVFSMVENIGDISLDSGFTEAWIIYGDRTIKGVGGGVCQVSTTLFRTVFFGGFPIIERYSHSYRVYYYELNASGSVNPNLAGLDATVYAPIVDFKFQNDTPYWLLMEVYVNPGARSITWKFYSTNDGRQVAWSTSGLQNVKEALDPVYEESAELDAGEIKQVDWAVEGADVTVTRTVTRDGKVLYEDVIRTHYEPWATVCQYGPGTRNYPPREREQDKYSCNRLRTGN
ncbi:MAG: VanW family protein [Chloroflexi bacterium]|nr:VanW family protein [Chloroflexota bacterium]